MDGNLSRETVRPFTNPRASLRGLDTDLIAIIIAAAADIAVVIDTAGTVCDVATSNELRQLEAAERWIGLPFSACVTAESVVKVEALLSEGHDRALTGWRHINHAMSGQDDVPVLYACASLGTEGRLICLGRDLRPMAHLQQSLVSAQQGMERQYARLRQSETRYRLLFQLCNEAVLICEASSQKIIEVNPAAADLIGPGQRRLVGRTFPDGLHESSVAPVDSLLATVRAAGRADPLDARLSNGARVTVHAALFRQEQAAHLLVRIIPRDAGPSQQEADHDRAVNLMQQLPDGFVVTNTQGQIRSANLAFLDLAEVASEEQVRGEDLGRWLGRPGVDFPLLVNSLREHGTVRLFSSAIRGEYGSTTEVEISATSTPDHDQLWMGFSIRPVQGRLRPRDGRTPELPRSLEQLTELIGRVPLKDLVRETTDVIERMCIESALTLTGDNRASAAEMLGLSRQSLYVKLRHYGLGDLPGHSGGDSSSNL